MKIPYTQLGLTKINIAATGYIHQGWREQVASSQITHRLIIFLLNPHYPTAESTLINPIYHAGADNLP